MIVIHWKLTLVRHYYDCHFSVHTDTCWASLWLSLFSLYWHLLGIAMIVIIQFILTLAGQVLQLGVVRLIAVTVVQGLVVRGQLPEPELVWKCTHLTVKKQRNVKCSNDSYSHYTNQHKNFSFWKQNNKVIISLKKSCWEKVMWVLLDYHVLSAHKTSHWWRENLELYWIEKYFHRFLWPYMKADITKTGTKFKSIVATAHIPTPHWPSG